MNTGPQPTASHPPFRGASARMYCLPGIGDCFLLSLPSQAERPFYLLVDCGVLFGTSGGEASLRRIAEDIRLTTLGCLDLVVVSKAHVDHMAGFLAAKDTFDRMQLKKFWVNWLDNPDDPFATQMLKSARFLLATLRSILQERSALNSRVQAELLKEIDGNRDVLPLQMVGGKVRDTIRYLIRRGHQTESYGSGDLVDLGSLRFYFLGPFRPIRSAGYIGMVQSLLGGMGLGDEKALDYTLQLLALAPTPEKMSQEERELLQRSRPFDYVETIPVSEAGKSSYAEFFKTSFGLTAEEGHGPAWRRIEPDWDEPAKYLIDRIRELQMASNQAVAIELVETGKVLLFPGDARLNDWDAWQNLSWKVGADGRTVTFRDLLARTVLYKVSHHGSKLGTDLQRGLGGMIAPGLTAMIPVNQEQAKKKFWQMPHMEVVEALRKRTGGRVLRMDQIPPQKPAEMAEADWAQFSERLTYGPDNLWVELKILDAEGNG